MTHASNYYVFKRTMSNQHEKKNRLPPTHIRGSSFLSKEVGIYNGRGPFISRKKSITALRTKPTTLIKGMHLDQSKKKG